MHTLLLSPTSISPSLAGSSPADLTSPKEAGEEILATYGAHSNDKLLVHYGFILSSPPGETPSNPNPDDDIRLDHLILPGLSDSVKIQLQDVGFLGAYALVPSESQNSRFELCFKTQVAIRAQLLSSNEWEYFMAHGEDLSTDYSEAVRTWVRPLLRGYYEEAQRQIKMLKNEKPQHKLLRGRWEQICEAISAF
jgi:hypothetical protein